MCVCVCVCMYVCMYVPLKEARTLENRKTTKLIVGERRIEDCESQKPLKMVQTR